METRSRDFTPGMAAFVKLRDQWCATPFRGAPIRHIDHGWPWVQGGPTSLDHANGKCGSRNYSSTAPGWTVTPHPDGTIRVTTPTGHDATSFTPPRSPHPPPGGIPPATAPPPYLAAPRAVSPARRRQPTSAGGDPFHPRPGITISYTPRH